MFVRRSTGAIERGGNRTLETVQSLELFCVKPGSAKPDEHLIRHKSEGTRRLTDYMLVRKIDMRRVIR